VPELDEKLPLIDALPDLVMLVRRDGVILSHVGGCAVSAIRPPADAVGKRLKAVWPESPAGVIVQLARRAIAQRTTLEISFENAALIYEARVSAQAPDRAICVIRAALPGAGPEDLLNPGETRRPQLDRRGFLQRFQQTLSLATISEKPAAVAVIHVDGVADIARVVDAKVSEQVLSAAILRLPAESPRAADQGDGQERQGESKGITWYLGQLNENLLALVIETADRDAIESWVERLCSCLREPVNIGDAMFHLTPYAGVAILGQDATSPKSLIEHARAAATEARRSGCAHARFFSDTLKLRSLARLDVARELRDAIANRDIRLRYTGRHDLATGRLAAWVGYLRWMHPLRGEVHPVEFLGVAETTGLAAALSLAVLQGVREDFAAAAPYIDPDVRISFGALRHHILNDDFVDDIRRFLDEGEVPASRLELRISERAFTVLDPSVCKSLDELGVRLVVDEVGRGMASIDRLARAPIWGLQLDRAWVTAVRSDEVALKVCRAGISAAAALGLTAIATGVDDGEQRSALLALGCVHGSGDLYRGTASDIIPYAKADESI
jgi:EAL domain-containing protein (putative c-di-GMP-specific phosphodiesterase class I)/GGDEF domain-containing protein